MTLFQIQEKYKGGEIDKWEYIDAMYKIHGHLFDYAELLNNTDIDRIEISAGNVIMAFKSSGVKLLCARGDKRIATIDALNFSTYEQSELSMQLRLMENELNIFDIGANYGWYSIHVARNRPKAKIFAFEPIPQTFEFLNRNIALNNVTNIQTFNFGFSNEKGEFTLYYDPKLSVNASLANVAGTADVETITCQIQKLNDYVSAHKLAIDFIKCDVEGAELMVFQGGKEAIARDRPIIFTEMLRKWTAKFNYSPNDIIDLFKSMNYDCFTVEGEYLKEFDWVSESTSETNYIFLHREKHNNKIHIFKK